MNAMPIYRQVLGENFERLPQAVREFHSVMGGWRYSGHVAIDGPENILGKIIAWCSGLPVMSTEQDFEFSIRADASGETWRRRFPDGDMVSRLRVVDGCLVEQLGIFQLRFRLEAAEDRLSMKIERITAFGIPCPRILFPQVSAKERGSGDRFHFDIEMHMPMAGRVVRYKGHLEMLTAAPVGDA